MKVISKQEIFLWRAWGLSIFGFGVASCLSSISGSVESNFIVGGSVYHLLIAFLYIEGMRSGVLDHTWKTGTALHIAALAGFAYIYASEVSY